MRELLFVLATKRIKPLDVTPKHKSSIDFRQTGETCLHLFHHTHGCINVGVVRYPGHILRFNMLDNLSIHAFVWIK